MSLPIKKFNVSLLYLLIFTVVTSAIAYGLVSIATSTAFDIGYSATLE